MGGSRASVASDILGGSGGISPWIFFLLKRAQISISRVRCNLQKALGVVQVPAGRDKIYDVYC